VVEQNDRSGATGAAGSMPRRCRPAILATQAELSRCMIVARKIGEATGLDMKRPLIVAISLICAAPLYAQHQQPDAVKLKADAQKVVNIIKGDSAKTQVYCEINDLGQQIGEADQKKDYNKAKALSRQITELEKRLGPEYFALMNDLNNVDLNTDDREIDSILASLDQSCD
jgi:hypothetical protein